MSTATATRATAAPLDLASVREVAPARKRGRGGWSTARRPAEERFWEKVDAAGDCWEWRGGMKPTGYGTFSIHHGKAVLPHRYAWEILIGPIPEGLTIDHQCLNTRCVNPAHLRLLPIRDNILASHSVSARNSRKTHCIHGHMFGPENTRLDRNGARRCLTCSKAHNDKWNKLRKPRDRRKVRTIGGAA